MSTKVDKFPGNRNIYDWSLWDDGAVHRCVQGEDFTSTLTSFCNAAYQYGKRREYKVVTKKEGNVVYLQIVRPKKLAKPALRRKK